MPTAPGGALTGSGPRAGRNAPARMKGTAMRNRGRAKGGPSGVNACRWRDHRRKDHSGEIRNAVAVSVQRRFSSGQTRKGKNLMRVKFSTMNKEIDENNLLGGDIEGSVVLHPVNADRPGSGVPLQRVGDPGGDGVRSVVVRGV